ncbi:MAG: FAD-dependent oxidoreductase [Clostridiales bacterium]|nr:FAD-dependent oxidoreductase [Clostridiales bacterium]
MDQVLLSKAIPFNYKTDVAVVCGGPSGFCAAVAAARFGVSTPLIEEAGFPAAW